MVSRLDTHNPPLTRWQRRGWLLLRVFAAAAALLLGYLLLQGLLQGELHYGTVDEMERRGQRISGHEIARTPVQLIAALLAFGPIFLGVLLFAWRPRLFQREWLVFPLVGAALLGYLLLAATR
jgi:hypothetical protein